MKINIKDIAEKKKRELKTDRKLRFGIIQVGDNPASNAYIKGKVKDCAEVGISATIYKFQESEDEEYLAGVIDEIQETLDAVIIQLPLPAHLDIDYLAQSIPREKDVDNLRGDSTFVPATPRGILMLLNEIGYKLEGKHVVILGRSKIVGEPMARLALERNATVSVCHSRTPFEKMVFLCNEADVIISAVGKQNFVTDMLINNQKPQLLIDVGINRNEEGKLCGDADPEIYSIENLEYTPVPGGVGLMTRIGLLANILGE